jgi:ribonuclease HII|tara:strand:- start:5360 stop:6010 length:651 start_codon:yes stop_codon:yes gene_type:complete
MSTLEQFKNENDLEVGLDEAGRGCLFGPVCVAGVIWLKEEPTDSITIKDSKRCNEKYRNKCADYIKGNAITYSIHMIGNSIIDKENILKCSIDGMHQCLDTISEKSDFNSILVDGNHFRTYYNPVKDEFIDHECIIKGDNKYKSIAAASILAKTHRDNYILDLVKRYPDLEKYDIQNNKGYGTKKHMDAIKKYGITQWHRNTFAPCKGLEINQMIE